MKKKTRKNKKANDNVVLESVYYLSEITTRTSNLKNTVLLLIDLQSDPPKSAANHVKGVESRPFGTTLQHARVGDHDNYFFPKIEET